MRLFDDSETPNAVVISIHGKCEYSEDGLRFFELKSQHVFTMAPVRLNQKGAGKTNSSFVFNQGAVIRTGKNSTVDIFLRRMGTTMRLQPSSEVKLEKMTRHMKDVMPVMETLLDLRTGRIFTVVRSLVPGSTLEIRNAAGRSVVEGGGGKGRYIITADGTQVTEKNSVVPLKVIRQTGVTVITPGMQFSAKEGKLFALATPESVKLLIEFDELDSLTEQWAEEEKRQPQK